MLMPVMVNADPPLLVRVTGCAALVVPTVWPAKVKVVGAKMTDGAVVPVSATVCGLPPPSSLIDTEAVLVPAAVGVNVTLMVQVPAAATLAPQVFVCAKSPASTPVMLTPSIVIVADGRVFVSVTVCSALVAPTAWSAKVKLTGLSCT
jgi:hypothetical protein